VRQETKNIIRVFEHEKLRVSGKDEILTDEQLKSFQEFYGSEGTPYYKLIHNGIQFTEYVGVIQIGNLTVEVLPKIDKYGNEDSWHNILVQMLMSVGLIKVHAPTSSTLQLQSNTVLDLYFELFISEVEYLIHRGLIKKYRKIEKNSTALKGPIKFSKHLQHNVIHQERFYIAQTVYDKNHKIHQILKKTIEILKRINTISHLTSRLGSLELNFPQVDDLLISKELFDYTLSRKDEVYRHALDISKLILLNYHPDIRKGQNNVLALMFDMNLLWEKFVFKSLQKHLSKPNTINAQNSKDFWKPIKGRRTKMRPDIVINKGKKDCIVLDTKWKNIKKSNPNPDDLRQLYVYKEYYLSSKVALIYPGNNSECKTGLYYKKSSYGLSENECAVITVKSISDINKWQLNIANQINQWINNP
jgi:5-methylcytosine-specific restriction enzyme subunit McrC